MKITVPDPGDRIAELTRPQWLARRAAMTEVAASAMWWLGDYINSAPSVDDLAAWLNADPRICPVSTVSATVVALQFPPDGPPTWTEYPWSWHDAAHRIPGAADRQTFMTNLPKPPHPLQEVKRRARTAASNVRRAD